MPGLPHLGLLARAGACGQRPSRYHGQLRGGGSVLREFAAPAGGARSLQHAPIDSASAGSWLRLIPPQAGRRSSAKGRIVECMRSRVTSTSWQGSRAAKWCWRRPCRAFTVRSRPKRAPTASCLVTHSSAGDAPHARHVVAVLQVAAGMYAGHAACSSPDALAMQLAVEHADQSGWSGCRVDRLHRDLSKRLPPSHLKDEVGPGGAWAAPVAWDRAESSVASSAQGSSAPEQARLASE